MTSDEMLKETAQELEKMLTSKSVLGPSIDIGDKTVIPINRCGFGFGAGGSHGEKGSGDGGGAAGGIDPVALVIVHKDVSGLDGIQVLSLKRSGMAQVVETLSESLAPRVIEAIKSISTAPKENKEK